MSNRQEKTAYEFTNYKPISVHKKVYDELTDLSNNIYDIKLSYAKTIEHLINYYKENKTKKLEMKNQGGFYQFIQKILIEILGAMAIKILVNMLQK
jgi:hypothetical protein